MWEGGGQSNGRYKGKIISPLPIFIPYARERYYLLSYWSSLSLPSLPSYNLVMILLPSAFPPLLSPCGSFLPIYPPFSFFPSNQPTVLSASVYLSRPHCITALAISNNHQMGKSRNNYKN